MVRIITPCSDYIILTNPILNHVLELGGGGIEHNHNRLIYNVLVFVLVYITPAIGYTDCVLHLFQDKRGLILVKTQSMLVVATYTENMFPSVCVEAVEKLGKTTFHMQFDHSLYSDSNSCSMFCIKRPSMSRGDPG